MRFDELKYGDVFRCCSNKSTYRRVHRYGAPMSAQHLNSGDIMQFHGWAEVDRLVKFKDLKIGDRYVGQQDEGRGLEFTKTSNSPYINSKRGNEYDGYSDANEFVLPLPLTFGDLNIGEKFKLVGGLCVWIKNREHINNSEINVTNEDGTTGICYNSDKVVRLDAEEKISKTTMKDCTFSSVPNLQAKAKLTFGHLNVGQAFRLLCMTQRTINGVYVKTYDHGTCQSILPVINTRGLYGEFSINDSEVVELLEHDHGIL